ncbi:hypothetical protein QL285_046461 [Trifolium repens]|nr:hypothetical protein QL285_046461 [Trifolium repens]
MRKRRDSNSVQTETISVTAAARLYWSSSSPLLEQQPAQWQKPNIGWYKRNVDVGFHNEMGKMSAGWRVRDYTGQFVIAGTSWIQGKCSIIKVGA